MGITLRLYLKAAEGTRCCSVSSSPHDETAAQALQPAYAAVQPRAKFLSSVAESRVEIATECTMAAARVLYS